MARKPSLYSDERECWICHSPYVDCHHIYGGVGRRPISDKEGCYVFLCRAHHLGAMGVHQDAKLMSYFRADCQRRWEEREGLEGEEAHDAFRAIFGISYI